jgi:hypothetical protein
MVGVEPQYCSWFFSEASRLALKDSVLSGYPFPDYLAKDN